MKAFKKVKTIIVWYLKKYRFGIVRKGRKVDYTLDFMKYLPASWTQTTLHQEDMIAFRGVEDPLFDPYTSSLDEGV